MSARGVDILQLSKRLAVGCSNLWNGGGKNFLSLQPQSGNFFIAAHRADQGGSGKKAFQFAALARINRHDEAALGFGEEEEIFAQNFFARNFAELNFEPELSADTHLEQSDSKTANDWTED